jgi:two-component sensor histidine kinase
VQAPRPANEAARLAALRSLGILDTPPDERFERITRVAQRIFGVPIALIGLMDAERQWFKSCRGLATSETPRGLTFCAHALESPAPLLVPDATCDPRFADNPSVTGPPYIRSYAGHPLRSPEGYTHGTLCIYVFRDITREREVDRMKSDFISRVSHELRTPLTSIKGFVDILLDGEAGEIGGEQREFLEIVSNNAERLVLLINDLLDVSRIESGRVTLKRAAVDLAPLARGVVASLRPATEIKGQQVALDMPPDLPAVDGDADRLRQILGNLLSHAHNQTPPGGAIRIAVSREGAVVRIAVGDSGPGFAPDEQERVFDSLFQAHNRATQGNIGTGLGLAIVRSLVVMHGGEITLASAPGAGSTFSFTLPLATPVTSPAADARDAR